MIRLEDLICGYSHLPVLEKINWHLQPAEHWVITGDMGSGKTTLARTIAGTTRKTGGRIIYSFLQNPESYEERKEKIHFVSFTDTGKLFNQAQSVHYYQQRYQAFDSSGHLTVKMYLEDGGLDLQNKRHIQLIDLLQLDPLLDVERIKLSSGQTRKLLLCKAFLGEPEFLIFDNPHIGLDDLSRNIFNNYVDQLVTTFDQKLIFSGHFRSLPGSINRQIQLHRGRVEYCGTVSGFQPGTEIKNIDIPPLLRNHLFDMKDIKPAEQILAFRDLRIKYEKNEVINHLDWEVKRGEKWLVQGPNGSGKSTIISLIYGDHPQAYSNRISLFGRSRGTGESIWDIKHKIGFTSPELHSYFKYNHPARDIVLSGLTDTFFVQKSISEKEQLCDALFEYFELKDHRSTFFNQLSTGVQRLLFFMRALIKSPPVLLLDEPYQGMDKHTIKKCNVLLEQLLSPEHTLIFISHFQDEVPDIVEKTLTLSGR